MVHPHGLRAHGLTLVLQARLLLGNTLFAKQPRQRRHQAIGQDRAARHLLACKDGQIDHRIAILQQQLTTCRVVIHATSTVLKPGVIALDEEADAVERHARLTIRPGVVRIDMIDQAVQTQRIVAIQDGFQHLRGLLPHATQRGEALGRDHALAIDMATADGIQHIVRFVVRGAVEPELAHRQIDLVVVIHAVADHRRGYALGRETATILIRLLGQHIEEYIVDQLANRLAHVTHHALRLLDRDHRNTRKEGQPRREVVAAARLELGSKTFAPILRAALPAIDIENLDHALGHLGIDRTIDCAKPVVDLLGNRPTAELVALQAATCTARGVRVARRGVAHAQDAPATLGERALHLIALQRSRQVDHFIGLDAVLGRDLLRARRARYTPHQTTLPLPLMDAGRAVETDLLDFKVRSPLRGIQVLRAGLTIHGSPIKDKLAPRGRGNGVGRLIVGILPTVTGRFELRHEGIAAILLFHAHGQAMRLVVIAREDDLDIVHLYRNGKGVADTAGYAGTNYPLLVDRGALLLGELLGQGLDRELRCRELCLPLHRHSQEGDILVIVLVMGRLGKLQLQRLATLDNGFARYDLLHRLLGRNPRATGQSKAVGNVHTELQAELVGLIDRRADTLPPILGQLIRVALKQHAALIVARTDRHEVGTTQPCLGHRAKVLAHPLLGDSAIHPIPQSPGLGIPLRCTEGLVEALRKGRKGDKERHECQRYGANGCFHRRSSSVFYKVTKSLGNSQMKAQEKRSFSREKRSAVSGQQLAVSSQQIAISGQPTKKRVVAMPRPFINISSDLSNADSKWDF